MNNLINKIVNGFISFLISTFVIVPIIIIMINYVNNNTNFAYSNYLNSIKNIFSLNATGLLDFILIIIFTILSYLGIKRL